MQSFSRNSLGFLFVGYHIRLLIYPKPSLLSVDKNKGRTAMDEFFSGLDCRLRVSGMVADSIMMGIVNSAMEDAYKKSCSKEGDLERLNEKSRFCELAIMQLEWCLKFLQEEADNNPVASVQVHQSLLSDLLETRDRIHNRLQETELAIAEKDRELSERKERESDLRLELEVKDEDISYLHTTLGLEKEKIERMLQGSSCGGTKNLETNVSHVLRESKSEVDRQIWKIKGSLEDWQQNFSNLTNKLNSYSLDSEFDDVDANEGLHDPEILNLETGLEELVIDFDTLKEKIDSLFTLMESSVSLFKMTLEEWQWVQNVERETVDLITIGCLKDVQYKLNSSSGFVAEKNSPILLDMDWVSLMDDFTSLRNVLEMLITQKEEQPKTSGGVKLRTRSSPPSDVNMEGNHKSKKNTLLGNYDFGGAAHTEDAGFATAEKDGEASDASSNVQKLGSREGQSKDSISGHSVAAMIRNHESIIRKKTLEIDWLKGALSKEKDYVAISNDGDIYSVKDMIAKIISRLDHIIKEKTKLYATCDEPKREYEGQMDSYQDNSSRFGSTEREPTVIKSTGELSQHSDNRLCCHLVRSELCEVIKQLKEDKKDLDTKTMILEETYAILFKGLLRKLHLESIDYSMDIQLRDDMARVIFSDMVEEWNREIDTWIIKRFLTEEIYCILFSEVVKDIGYAVHVSLTNCHDKDLPSESKLSQSSEIIRHVKLHQEMDTPSTHFIVHECLKSDLKSQLLETHSQIDLIGPELEESNKQHVQLTQLSVTEDGTFSGIQGNMERSLQQIDSSKIQLGRLVSNLGSSSEKDMGHDQVSSVSCSIQDGKCSKCLPIGYEEKDWTMLQVMLMPLTEFSQAIMEFEHTSCEKIRANMTRLEGLNHLLNPLVEQISMIKKKEMLYRKAFIRRCYDLQTAEAEVDLLGDDVDLLISLLKKIHKVLNHYSPVLQHYFGVMNVLRLIREELGQFWKVTMAICLH